MKNCTAYITCIFFFLLILSDLGKETEDMDTDSGVFPNILEVFPSVSYHLFPSPKRNSHHNTVYCIH
jgi:hypothetical protein